MSEPPVLEIADVSFVAGGTTILNHVSWRVLRGEHWAILGPNGAGKTTLLRIACGFQWPNSGGSVRRMGKDSVDLRELRRSIGWISCRMNAEIPAAEPVMDTVVSGKFAQLGLKRMNWDLPTEVDYELAAEFLNQLNCEALISKTFGVLSQGEQQNVLIARARMAEPLLIILDEPCAGMDPGARERFLTTLSDLIRNPSAPGIILVTHHLEEIVPGLNKTLVINQGQIAASGRTEDVISADMIASVYGVPVSKLVAERGRWWPIWGELDGQRPSM